MHKKRIIPCLDILNGETVKGINFENIRKAGDPVTLAKKYVKERADELVFLDITATVDKRKMLTTLVEKIAKEINIPFTVGGGIASKEDVSSVLNAGADKVSINSAAVNNPKIIDTLASEFGSQCIVLAIDAGQYENQWRVFINGGRIPTTKGVEEWAKEGYDRGAGEILLTSMLHDGTKNGFACELTQSIAQKVNIPIIASGGAGEMNHFKNLFHQTQADAALAASIFHYGEMAIPDLKSFLKSHNIPIRM